MAKDMNFRFWRTRDRNQDSAKTTPRGISFVDDINRGASLMRLVPDLFSNKHKTVLYIGAHDGRFEFGEKFRAAGYEITILEAFERNCDFLRKTLPWLKEVIHADIKDYSTGKVYDIVFWWHGPEHLKVEEIAPTLTRLERFGKIIILGCPWGDYPQDAVYGNPYEVHQSHHDPDFFLDLGYRVECLGRRGVFGSNITSVKINPPTRIE